MTKYRCFIVDDEPLAIDAIASHLDKLPQFQVKGKFTEALKAYTALKNTRVDLIFLDIQMPDYNGLDFIKSIQKKPEIIITTAFREFAVEGFELNILDYLVKPVAFERFMKSIDKFLDKKAKGSHSSGEGSGFVMVRADRKFIKIKLDDILYIEGLKDYVRIVLPEQQVLTRQSIGNFYQNLNEENFLQIHKSFIVSKSRITAYTSHEVEIGKFEIPIGRIYKEAFLQVMKDNT